MFNVTIGYSQSAVPIQLASAFQDAGPGGWRLDFTETGTMSCVLYQNLNAPGTTPTASNMTTVAYYDSNGAVVSAGTALTASGYVTVDAVNADLWVIATLTGGDSVAYITRQISPTVGNEPGEGTLPTNNPTFTGTLTGSTSAVTARTGTTLTLSGATAANSISATLTSATPSTNRLTLSEVTLTPATTVAVSGSIAGVRGAITVTAGKTFTEGFLYGAQGKVTLAGTMNEGAAARIAGVIGQVDMASGTLTDGQVSAIWGDIQSTAPTLTDFSQLNLIRATNSMAGTSAVNAVLFAYGRASYFAQLGADGGAANVAYWGAVAPTSLAKSLKIMGPDGVAYYIGCYSAAS